MKWREGAGAYWTPNPLFPQLLFCLFFLNCRTLTIKTRMWQLKAQSSLGCMCVSVCVWEEEERQIGGVKVWVCVCMWQNAQGTSCITFDHWSPSAPFSCSIHRGQCDSTLVPPSACLGGLRRGGGGWVTVKVEAGYGAMVSLHFLLRAGQQEIGKDKFQNGFYEQGFWV